MAQQLRVYKMKPGQLTKWVDFFQRGTAVLRAKHGFEIQAWAVPDKDEFVWLVTFAGTRADFEAADKAYYALPEHKPLHEEATNYLDSSTTWFLDPVELRAE